MGLGTVRQYCKEELRMSFNIQGGLHLGWLLLGCDPYGSLKHLYAYPRVKRTHVCDCHSNITTDSHFGDKNVKTEVDFQLGYLWTLWCVNSAKYSVGHIDQ